MKPIRFISFRIVLPLASLIILVQPAAAEDRWWDAGTTNIGTAGDGVTVFASGTWNTTTNWDQGAGLAHGARNNAAAPLDNAVVSGPGVSGTGTVTLTVPPNTFVKFARLKVVVMQCL